MIDLRANLTDVCRAAGRLSSNSGGRNIMVIGARQDEGVSSVAASLALLFSGRSSKSTWLVDLDLKRNGQYDAFHSGFGGRAGRPGRAYDASLNQPPFYSVMPSVRAADGAARGAEKLLSAHRVGNTRLMVTRFRSEYLKPGQRVQIESRSTFWSALRGTADWGVIDAPALDESGAGLAIARQMDGVVLVFRADRTKAEEVASLRREVEGHGGRCIGMVMNEIRADARLADRFAP